LNAISAHKQKYVIYQSYSYAPPYGITTYHTVSFALGGYITPNLYISIFECSITCFMLVFFINHLSDSFFTKNASILLSQQISQIKLKPPDWFLYQIGRSV